MEDAAGGAGQRRTRAGVNWKPERGKLYRFWGGEQPGSGGVTVIRPWPAPAAWAKDDRDKGFHHAVPRIDLFPVHPDESRRRNASWPGHFEKRAWAWVPAPVRGAVCRAHLQGQQWRALSLQARVPGARQLAEDVPLLAALLSVGNAIRPAPVARPLRSARALLLRGPGWKTWRRTAAWLGLGDSKAMVRVLRKAGRSDDPPGAWSVSAARGLAAAWTDDHARTLLLHLPRTTPLAAEMISSVVEFGHSEVLTPQLLAEVIEQEDRFVGVTLLRSLMWVAVHQRAPWLARPIRDIATLEARSLEAGELHDAAEDRQPWRTLPFPPPPLPAPEGGRALDSPEALVREGEEMAHCIGGGTYERLARCRHGYGYALALPTGERATVWIERDPALPGAFRMQQLQGPGNARPSEAMIDLVADWLRDQRAWPRHRRGQRTRPAAAPPAPLPVAWRLPPEGPNLAHDPIPF